MSFEVRLLSRLAALCGLAASVGCATTGLGWVNEPESGADLTPPPSNGPTPEMPPSRQVQSAPADAVAPPPRSSHRRLDHTVTLGEVNVLDARSEPSPAPREGSVINIYVTPSAAPEYAGYYGVGYGFGTAPFATVPARGVRVNAGPPPMRPGLDWPAVPNHGAPFPYRTSPASPWEGTGSRRR